MIDDHDDNRGAEMLVTALVICVAVVVAGLTIWGMR